MNSAQLGGLVRTLLLAVAAYLSGRGIDISGLTSPEVSASLVTVGVAVWSIWAKRGTNNLPPN